MKHIYLFLLVVFLLSAPTFLRMVQPGIFSMQDFPYFRLVEYAKCLTDAQLPCRWAMDAGLGYGEPVFNFYSHIPFLLGATLVQFGFSAVNSLKFVFAFSLFASALAMFLLSRQIWKNNWAALLSSMLYLYAPYRAVDVWVRGALPESFAFIFLPLILYFFEGFLESKKKLWLSGFTLSLTFLILTHNLSVILFSFVIIGWIVIRMILSKKWHLLPYLLISGVFSLLLSAFYLLPATTEASLVNLATTTQGYFDFRAHFVTLPQLFLSRYWGYGGSTWGDQDGLSLGVGQVQWLVASVVFIVALLISLKHKKFSNNEVIVVTLSLFSVFCIFLTHNQSAFLWEAFSGFMKYIQFPWRFLGAAVFSMSLMAGYLVVALKKHAIFVSILLIVMVIIFNVGFFKEDLWFAVSDSEMQSGEKWVEQTRASIGDYWPIYGPIPRDKEPARGDIVELERRSNSAKYVVTVGVRGNVTLPVTFFPGWGAQVDNKIVLVAPDSDGLITLPVEKGINRVDLKFHETGIRRVAKIISVLALLLSVLWLMSGIFSDKRRQK